MGAVAPRVCGSPPARGRIGAYEARHSALDMGPRGGLVAPGRPVSYVPGAVIFARRDAIPGGFDETLRVGEDVDSRGGACAEPDGACATRPRWPSGTTTASACASSAYDRLRYARSLGALSRRHPGAAPAMWAGSLGLALTWPWPWADGLGRR